MKSKCEEICKNIISESAENSFVKYKAYGYWQLSPDDYEKGVGDTYKIGVFDDYFGETAVEAVSDLCMNENIKLHDINITDINGKTEIQGNYYVEFDNDFEEFNIEEDKEYYDKWKAGKYKPLLLDYQIIVQKLVYSNLDEVEIKSIYDEFNNK